MTDPLHFRLLEGRFAILRFSPTASVPGWIDQNAFLSITRTSEELSIVCGIEQAPDPPALRWICLQLCGPFPFSQTGVLLSFIQPLSSNGVPIFTISTYDTDYVLIPEEQTDKALALLRNTGHILET